MPYSYPFDIRYGIFSQSLIPVPIVCQDFFSCGLLAFYIILKLLTIFAGAAAVIAFIIAGIKLIVSPGQESLKEVKDILLWGTLGLILALTSWGLVKLIESTVAKGSLQGLINFAYAQSLRFVPSKISCAPVTVFDILRGRGVPPGLLGKCLLWLAGKFLTIIYTLSLLGAIAFLIIGGIHWYFKPGDKQGRDYIIWSIIGAIITILSYSIVRAIEYSLTQ